MSFAAKPTLNVHSLAPAQIHHSGGVRLGLFCDNYQEVAYHRKSL